MSNWSDFTFGADVKLDNSPFDTKVGGSKFLDIGKHQVMRITEVEPKRSKAGNNYIKLRFENEDGAGINTNIMLNGKPDELGNNRFHWTYTKLANSVAAADLELALEFFGKELPKTPSLFESLIGMVVGIKVGHGKEGYVIMDSPTGGKVLVDIETNERFPDTEVYEGYAEAKEAAEELNLKRCYNEVEVIFPSTKEMQEKNVEAIKKILKSGAKKPVNKQPVSL